MTTAARCRETAEAAWRWVLDQVRHDDLGPWIPASVTDPPATEAPWDRDGMHSGVGGLAHLLAELRRSREWTAEESGLAEAIGRRLREATATKTVVNFFDGVVSDIGVFALLGEEGIESSVARLLELEPESWPRMNDATLGTGALVVGGLRAAENGSADGLRLTARAADLLLAEAEETPAGLNWLFVPRRLVPEEKLDRGRVVEMPNWSHGLAGIAGVLAQACLLYTSDAADE